jgi:dTMP kinase
VAVNRSGECVSIPRAPAHGANTQVSATTERGIFITLEGPDGAGKSSQAALLAERLRGSGREVVLTREPGGTALGEQVRRVLLDIDTQGEPHDAFSDAFLFNAARRQLVAQVIAPALARHAVVVCDRFADSTLAYQGYGAGADLARLRVLAGVAVGRHVPDRTLLLDLAPEAGLRRRSTGDQAQVTRFESDAQHDIAFHRRVRDGYLALAAADSSRWRVIDADRSPDAVARDAWRAVLDLFETG